MAANFEEVATQFVTFYYSQFDSDRKQLAALYVSKIEIIGNRRGTCVDVGTAA
jgi:hypothetical protein